MKQKITLSIVVILLIITNFYNVKANTEFNISNEKQETAYLEDLLQNKEEQKKTEQALDESKINKLEDKEKSISTITMSDVNYNAPGYGSATFISEADSSNGFDWFIYGLSVYKHDILKNENTLIYKMGNDEKPGYIAYYYNNDIIYLMYVKNFDTLEPWGTVHDKTYIVGISTKEEKLVYEGVFNVPQVKETYLQSFAVDSQGRFYIVYEQTGIRIFDKNGSLIYDHKPIQPVDDREYIYIKGISPNDKVLFFESMHRIYENYAYFQSVYEGQQKLDTNGSFVNKGGYTIYGRSYPSLYSKNPVWKFLDKEGTYAVDQYGRIAKFNYDVPITENSPMGCDREFIFDASSGVVDYTLEPYPKKPNVCRVNNDVYIMGSNCNIYKVNINSLECKQYISTGLTTYGKAEGLTYFNNCLYLKMTSPQSRKKFTLDASSFTNTENKVYTNKDSQAGNRQINDIVAKYNEMKPKFDYKNSIYQEIPSWKKPYSAGSLKKEVITDTLNMLNYYRWLVGAKEIGINTDKMIRNQKGAVLMKANGDISHTPSQPTDMEKDFYDEAYDGCNAKYKEGDTYSGNVGFGDRTPYEAIQGYVSDLYNVVITSATGHRQSMLDPQATGVSLGFCETYSAVSVYYDDKQELDENKFYSFPAPGYFPNTEMKVGEYWSINMSQELSGKIGIKLTYKGNTYNATNIVFEDTSPLIVSFKLPKELRDKLGGEYDSIPSGTSIQVEMYGMQDANLNSVSYKYTVDFFSMLKKGDVNNDGKVTLYDALQILKQSIFKGSLTDGEKYIMDYNDDGKVTLYDALKFLQQAIIG